MMIAEPGQLTIHNAVTWFMAGVVWTIQLVHYPLFGTIDRALFSQAHAMHSRRITFIVAPAMLLEGVLSAALLLQRGMADWPAASGFTLVLIIWTLTAFVIVPLHDRLARPDRRAGHIDSLVQWNWFRTIAWTARAVICLLFL